MKKDATGATSAGSKPDGRLVYRQTIFEGIESCVDAMNGLFTGANIGKMLVKVSEPTVVSTAT